MDGCLPYFAVSTWALLHLLARWAYKKEVQGGLRDVDSRSSAAAMLDSAFGQILANGPSEFTIALDLTDDWNVSWPRPQSFDEKIEITVSRDGVIDLSKWETHSREHGGPSTLPRNRWLANIKTATDGGFITLKRLFVYTLANTKLESLHKQLLWKCGHFLQLAVTDLIKGKHRGNWSCTTISLEDLLDYPHQMDAHLVRYVESSRLAFSSTCKHISLATDKSDVGGLALQTTILTRPNNTAVVACPQVLFNTISAN